MINIKWEFDLFTILQIILNIIIFIFLLIDYIKFNKFIMKNNERERLFTNEMYKKYLDNIKNDDNKENSEVKFDF